MLAPGLSLAIVTAREGDKRQAKKIVNSVRGGGEIEKPIRRHGGGVCATGEPDEAVAWFRSLQPPAHEGGFAECQVDPMLEPAAATEGLPATCWGSTASTGGTDRNRWRCISGSRRRTHQLFLKTPIP